MFTLEFKGLPFNLELFQVVYIESGYNEELNRCINENYEIICDSFARRGFKFYYLPNLSEKYFSYDVLKYYLPHNDICYHEIKMKSDFMLRYLVTPDACNELPPSLLFTHHQLSNKVDDSCQLMGISLLQDIGSDWLECLLDAPDLITREFRNFQKESTTWSKLKRDIFNSGKNIVEEEDDSNYPLTADDRFDYESKILIREIAERIKKLKQKGIDEYLLQQLLIGNDKPS